LERDIVRARRLAFGIAFCVMLTLAAALPGAGSTPTRLERDLGRRMDRLVAAGAPGVILLVRNGDQTIRLARGFANIAQKDPMRTGDRFRIASLTKSYTAAVVLALVGERKLALDDTVEQHIPNLLPDGEKITIRHLLNHTSGLFDFWQDERFFKRVVAEPARTWTPQERIAVANGHKPLFAPGAGWSYSNTGYIVLGLIVEKVTGHSLDQELRARIFSPLGLRDTTTPATHRIEGRHARGYIIFDKPPPQDITGVSASLAWGHGHIVSTAADVAGFYRALLIGRLIDATQLHAMKTTVATNYGGGERYGLGIVTGRFSCGAYWGHDGEFAGYVSAANNSADGRRQVVVMVNTSSLLKTAKGYLNQLIEAAYCD
jgi:D-alanyl-D-alanine carboxypeptidase